MDDVWGERQRPWPKQYDDARSPADVDYARIIHSASFRRLQGKTQILNLGDSDFYRTRLTHSLEVAQIAGGIVKQFRTFHGAHDAAPHFPEAALIQAIGLAHDLGHPPFGHGGEVALNYCMREHGGFEGNGQTLRILSRLEKMSESRGSNLMRRTLLGILKYPAPYKAVVNPKGRPALADASAVSIIDREKSTPPKCYLDSEQQVVDWLVAPLGTADRDRFHAVKSEPDRHGHRRTVHKSFDCCIMDLADDIAYGVHDLEDAIALRLVDREVFRKVVTAEVCRPFLDALRLRYPEEYGNEGHQRFVAQLFGDGGIRKRTIGRLVHYFISAARITEDAGFTEPLLRFRASLAAEPQAFLKALKDVVCDSVILSPQVQHLEFKGQKMVVSVFEVFQSEPKAFLPPDTYGRFRECGEDPRVICDHVAGMTDSFLLKTYERLFSPRMGSVFDRL